MIGVMGRSFKNYVFVLIAIISIYGKCNKIDINECAGSCYNITGIVKDSLTGAPIANAEVELATINGALFYAGTFGSGVTNSNGIYNLFFPSSRVDFSNYNLLVSIKAPSGYIADDHKDLKSVSYKIFKSDSPKIDVPIIINASFLKKAFLNVRIIKTAPSNSLNSFGFRFGSFGYHSIGAFPTDSNTDTTYRFETAADIKNYLNWETKTSATINKFIDSIVIAPGQTKDFMIRL
jgi:hypothetical protein